MATSEGFIQVIVVNDARRNATVTLNTAGSDTYKITDDSDSSFGGMLNLCIASKVEFY